MSATLGTKTATICVGNTANGPADAYAFTSQLIQKGYTGVPYGANSGNSATQAAFNDGKNRAVMYWTSHGYSVSDGSYELAGENGRFNAGPVVLSWTQNDPIEALFLASCYAFKRTAHRQGFAQALRNSNLFTVCGYKKQAPAGSSYDVDVVNDFFSSLNNGDGVAYAWKSANQEHASSSWGLVQYGSITANINYKLPGWGSNSGIDRSQAIWYLDQTTASIINNSNSAASSFSASLPLQITLSPAKRDLPYSLLGNMDISENNQSSKIRYREWNHEGTDAFTLRRLAMNAISNLEIESLYSQSIIENSIIQASILDGDDSGKTIDVGADYLIRQHVNGIPVESCGIRICLDKNGVHHIENTWSEISLSEKCLQTKAADELIYDLDINNEDVARSFYVYAKSSGSTCSLCRKILMKNDDEYCIDMATGKSSFIKSDQ